MHHIFFVTFNKEAANNSQEARNHVIERLHDEHFCCGEGRWARGIADWFVIGGRWSGELSGNVLGKDILNQRDEYKVDGYEDDAMILTKKLYDSLLKEHKRSDNSEYHADLDYDPVSPDMAGRKWIVLVDYYSSTGRY